MGESAAQASVAHFPVSCETSCPVTQYSYDHRTSSRLLSKTHLALLSPLTKGNFDMPLWGAEKLNNGGVEGKRMCLLWTAAPDRRVIKRRRRRMRLLLCAHLPQHHYRMRPQDVHSKRNNGQNGPCQPVQPVLHFLWGILRPHPVIPFPLSPCFAFSHSRKTPLKEESGFWYGPQYTSSSSSISHSFSIYSYGIWRKSERVIENNGENLFDPLTRG